MPIISRFVLKAMSNYVRESSDNDRDGDCASRLTMTEWRRPFSSSIRRPDYILILNYNIFVSIGRNGHAPFFSGKSERIFYWLKLYF